MTCVLCDSWAGCPVNPHTLHPRPRTTITDQDVEVALLTGYMWGTVDPELCSEHRQMVDDLKKRLCLVPKHRHHHGKLWRWWHQLHNWYMVQRSLGGFLWRGE